MTSSRKTLSVRSDLSLAWIATSLQKGGNRFISSTIAFDQFGPATLVDVGGSQGTIGMAITSAFPAVKCIVQDRPEVVAAGAAHVPESLSLRVTFMAHDFLTPQPVNGADFYLLRWILHDWADKYCVQILESLTPALKRGAKVLVVDSIMPEPGMVSMQVERQLRYDMNNEPHESVCLLMDTAGV